MDKKVQKISSQPNYKKIYKDFIARKHPDKMEACALLLNKEHLLVIDLLRLDQIIFERKNKDHLKFDQQHRSYDQNTIEQILTFKKTNNLNNTQVARQFNMSRNTVAKWLKIFG